MSIFLAMENDAIESYSINEFFFDFFYQVKKITWKKEKSKIMYKHIPLIFMFRIPIGRTQWGESNEHIFSNGKWRNRKLFNKWGFFFWFFLPSQKNHLERRKK